MFVTLGVAIVVATFFAARLTRPRADTGPDPDSPWRPRPLEDTEPRRMRLWPVATTLVGILLLSGGLLGVDPGADPDVAPVAVADPTPRPYLLEVQIATAPSPEPTPEPTPEPSATPATPSRGGSSGSSGSSGGSGSGGGSGGTAPSRPPTPAPTPTPTPKPGPAISASTSCFSNALQIGYTASARSGTTLAGLRVDHNGSTVQQPSVSGRSQYSGNYQTSAPSGDHTFTVTASGSDGGVTVRTYSVRCA